MNEITWLTGIHDTVKHAVYHGEGQYTEFYCGKEEYAGDLRMPVHDDVPCPECVDKIT